MGMERWLPVAYFVAALLLAVALLPSILRQSPPQPNQTAELSPDAPPDPHQQPLIAALNRAQSGTAGNGNGNGAGAPGGAGSAGTVTPPAAGPPGITPRSCPFGFGNPPRQTFSLYSGPCAPAWTGDNGGATSKGVSPTEVRVAVGWPTGDSGTAGPVPASRHGGESDNDRTMIDIQRWLNSRYQLWGRRIQLYVVNGGDNQADYPSIAAEMDQEIHAFAAVYGRYKLMADLAHRGIVAFGEQLDQFSEAFYSAHDPYLWNWTASTTDLLGMSAEYVCKKLIGHPAEFAGTSDLKASPRKLGILFNHHEGAEHLDQEFAVPLAKECGGRVDTRIAFEGASSFDQTAIATAVTRLHEEGVTTVVVALDFVTMSQLTAYAASSGYVPEWLVTGVGNTDFPEQAREFMSQAEWAHAFGLSALELEYAQNGLDGNVAESDCYRAVVEVDPSASPQANPCISFASLLQVANGIQGAGPRLTPDTFEQGLFHAGTRLPSPAWSIGGGYTPGRHAYPLYAGEIWYDAGATNSQGTAGNYRWTHRGQKLTFGQWDTDVSELFKSGYTMRRQVESH